MNLKFKFIIANVPPDSGCLALIDQQVMIYSGCGGGLVGLLVGIGGGFDE